MISAARKKDVSLFGAAIKVVDELLCKKICKTFLSFVDFLKFIFICFYFHVKLCVVCSLHLCEIKHMLE